MLIDGWAGRCNYESLRLVRAVARMSLDWLKPLAK